eukprot:TRINITY_DN17383_c0_g2_i2.p2 TRINITY_DN17383_c0_g2~~TRINITY_DN17383_c0_g2_i2.p2  ORF type:complete len:136 (+),score=19.70 TRINITY_DN17383_c0_g2_i2:109-516(+)
MSDDGGFSAWGWLGKAKAAVQDASTKLQDTVAVPTSLNKALDNMMSLEDPDKKTTKPEEYTPWSTVPAKWKARSGEWEALVKGLVGSEAYVPLWWGIEIAQPVAIFFFLGRFSFEPPIIVFPSQLCVRLERGGRA